MIFMDSDFTWNQFWWFRFRGSDAWFSMIFCTFTRLKFPKFAIFTALKTAKMAVFAFLESSKLISRTIWVAEKSCNFHTVDPKLSFNNTVWKFQDYTITQKLREINFVDSGSAKTAIFAILGAVNFVHLGNFTLAKVQKCIKNQIQSLCMCVKWLILHFKNPQNWFHVKSESMNIFAILNYRLMKSL